jgi:hypothetical protein
MSRWIALVLVLLPAPARAWNPHGHRVVAASAYAQLRPSTRRQVATLLALHPAYPRWTAGVTPGQRAEAAFLRASNWADDIRVDPSIPEADKHKDWHYTNRPYSPDGTPARPAPVPNVETQLRALRRQLVAPSSTPHQRAFALVWLLHLVGDVHQPLHCVARFDRFLPQGDRGGTLVLLSADPQDHLHGFWDRAAGDGPDLASARRDAAQLPAPATAQLAVSDEAAWVSEGEALARQHVYVAPVGPGPGPFRLDDAYVRTARTVARQRLALAGARLARLLNEALR